ncbi:MAG: glycerophosphoryl diester phosphodiesterase membrane domain-containing protein [Candidatus Aenigmatarchaeota archaeon]
MSLFADSLSYTFEFWKENFSKIFFYQLLFLALNGLAGFIIVVGLLFLFFISSPLGLIPFILIAGSGFVLLLVLTYVQFAGYSLMVKRVKEKKKIGIIEIFKECFRISHKILAVGIIQSLPIIIITALILSIVFILLVPYFQRLNIPDFSHVGVSVTGLSILPFIKPTSMEISPDYTFSILLYLIILVIVLGIVLGYVNFRIWLSIPVLMLEKRGCIESVKESWRITKGKFWSIFFVNLVMGFVVGMIRSMVELPFNLLEILFVFAPYIGQVITYLIFTPLSLILPAAYYYSIKAEERKREV